MLNLFKFLQWFGEGGGDGGAGAAPGGPADGQAGGEAGVIVPDAGERKPQRRGKGPSRLPYEYGQPQETQTQPAAEQPHEESFEELIKGKYKEEYGKAVQGVIAQRFKNANAVEQRGKDAEDLLAKLAGQKYGIQAGEDGRLDLAALRSKMQEDDDLYEDKAMELGTSTETARKFSEMEEELNRLRAERQNREQYAAYQQVVAQAEQAKKIFPGLDLQTEMDNPDFARLIRASVPVETAYRVIHANEITAQQTAYAAQQAKAAVSASIQAGQNRPSENGLGRSAAANTNRITNPKLLTKEQRADIRRRVAAGEQIAW